jgi:hypothetical protein
MNKHERQRQKVWTKAFNSIAGCVAVNTYYDDAIRWADKCLADFDMRFPAPGEKSNPQIKVENVDDIVKRGLE